jgi:hypothetical protein
MSPVNHSVACPHACLDEKFAAAPAHSRFQRQPFRACDDDQLLASPVFGIRHYQRNVVHARCVAPTRANICWQIRPSVSAAFATTT